MCTVNLKTLVLQKLLEPVNLKKKLGTMPPKNTSSQVVNDRTRRVYYYYCKFLFTIYMQACSSIT